MTGDEATFGTQLKNGAEQAVADINAAGGVLGKKLKLEVGDDACDPKQARVGRREVRQHEAAVRRRALLLVVVDPGVGSLCRGRRAADHAGLDQPDVHRAQACGTRSASAAATTSRARSPATTSPRTTRARTSPSSTTRRPTAKASPTRRRRRSTRPACKEKIYEAYNKGDKDFTALVSKLKRDNDRRRLCRRLPHRGRPDPAPDARPGHEDHADRRRRARRPTSSGRSPARPAKACCSPSAPTRARSRPPPRSSSKFKDKSIDPEGYTLYTYAAFQIWAQAATKAKHAPTPRRSPRPSRPASGTPCSGKISYDKKGDITAIDYVVYKWDKERQLRRDCRPARARNLAFARNASPPRSSGAGFFFGFSRSCPAPETFPAARSSPA